MKFLTSCLKILSRIFLFLLLDPVWCAKCQHLHISGAYKRDLRFCALFFLGTPRGAVYLAQADADREEYDKPAAFSARNLAAPPQKLKKHHTAGRQVPLGTLEMISIQFCGEYGQVCG